MSVNMNHQQPILNASNPSAKGLEEINQLVRMRKTELDSARLIPCRRDREGFIHDVNNFTKLNLSAIAKIKVFPVNEVERIKQFEKLFKEAAFSSFIEHASDCAAQEFEKQHSEFKKLRDEIKKSEINFQEFTPENTSEAKNKLIDDMKYRD